jgi:hypothetical protein
MAGSTSMAKTPAIRPASAVPSAATRARTGKCKKADTASAGKRELEKRKNLPDAHPDKIFVPLPPETEAQWCLSIVDAPLLPSLVHRYADVGAGLSLDPSCVACVWNAGTRLNSIYVLDKAIATEKTMHVFHLEDNRWELLEVRGQVPALEHGCTATAVGERLVVLGGHSVTHTSLSRSRTSLLRPEADPTGWVHSFDTKTGLWSKQPVESAFPRKGHSATLVGTSIYIYGGDLVTQPLVMAVSDQRVQSDMVLLNTASMSIFVPEVSGDKPPRRSFHSATLVPHILASPAHHDAAASEPAILSEDSVEEAVGGRGAQSAGALYVFGGKVGSVCVNDLLRFDTSTNSWTYPVTTGRYVCLCTSARTRLCVGASACLCTGACMYAHQDLVVFPLHAKRPTRPSTFVKERPAVASPPAIPSAIPSGVPRLPRRTTCQLIPFRVGLCASTSMPNPSTTTHLLLTPT